MDEHDTDKGNVAEDGGIQSGTRDFRSGVGRLDTRDPIAEAVTERRVTAYASVLSDDATDALNELRAIVNDGLDAENVGEDVNVARDVVALLRDLDEPDRIGVVHAATLLFTDRTERAIAEARAASLAVLADSDSFDAPIEEIIQMLAEGVAEAVDEIEKGSFIDRLREYLA